MEKSISETLAEMRAAISTFRAREDAYNDQGFLKNPEPFGGDRKRIYTPNDSQELQEARFSHEDNFDPS